MLLLCATSLLILVLPSSSHPTSSDEESAAVNALPKPVRRASFAVNASSPDDWEVDVNASFGLSETSLSDVESDNLTHALQLRCRQRKKLERITLIRHQILSQLQVPRQQVPHLSQEDRRRMSDILTQVQRLNPADDDVQMMQSLYPACSIPFGTEREAWEEPDAMRVSYDLRPAPDVNVVAAKLRLHRATGRTRTPPGDSEEVSFINVNVYQIIKPLKANKREKKRLVDSRTVPVDFSGWLELNVTSSVRFWFRHPNKNFGFDVRVEDDFGQELKPGLYFQTMNCSSEGRPFPNLQEMYRELETRNESSSLLDNETFPTLDLRTARHGHDLRKRAAEDSSCTEQQEYVSFKTLGIDNVVLRPEGFRWMVCAGTCSHQEEKTTEEVDSAVVVFYRNFFKLKRPSSTNGCIVTRYGDLKMDVVDKNGVVSTRWLRNFVPEQCGCRTTTTTQQPADT